MEINQERGITDMFVKKFKRKCDVRGCKNTANVFLISKRREMGNTIAICTECLKEAQSSIDGYVEEKKVVIKENKPLFPHPELDVTLSSVADNEPKPPEVIEEATEDIPISVAEDIVTTTSETEVESYIEPTPVPKPKTVTNNKNKSKKK